MAAKNKKNAEPENYPVLVKLRGSQAELTGEHTVFIDGGRITFTDGEVTVTNVQYEVLKNAGYALEGNPVIEPDPELDPDGSDGSGKDDNQTDPPADDTNDSKTDQNTDETGEGKEGGAE